MTTPERLRRRQLIESALLIVVGIAMLLQSAYFAGKDKSQQECLERNFIALSDALSARSDLAGRDSSSTQRVISTVAQVETNEQLREAFDVYMREQERIEQIRRENPLPPYPPGTCGEG